MVIIHVVIWAVVIATTRICMAVVAAGMVVTIIPTLVVIIIVATGAGIAALVVVVVAMSEDDFVKFSDTFQTAPPMPWYNVHALTDVEARSLYQYIKSLPGGLGEQAPPMIPPKG